MDSTTDFPCAIESSSITFSTISFSTLSVIVSTVASGNAGCTSGSPFSFATYSSSAGWTNGSPFAVTGGFVPRYIIASFAGVVTSRLISLRDFSTPFSFTTSYVTFSNPLVPSTRRVNPWYNSGSSWVVSLNRISLLTTTVSTVASGSSGWTSGVPLDVSTGFTAGCSVGWLGLSTGFTADCSVGWLGVPTGFTAGCSIGWLGVPTGFTAGCSVGWLGVPTGFTAGCSGGWLGVSTGFTAGCSGGWLGVSTALVTVFSVAFPFEFTDCCNSCLISCTFSSFESVTSLTTVFATALDTAAWVLAVGVGVCAWYTFTSPVWAFATAVYPFLLYRIFPA